MHLHAAGEAAGEEDGIGGGGYFSDSDGLSDHFLDPPVVHEDADADADAHPDADPEPESEAEEAEAEPEAEAEAEAEADGHAERPEPKRVAPGSKPPKAWKDRGGYALHDYTRVTVRELCARLLMDKCSGRITNEAMVDLMAHYASTAPPGHLYPTTLAQLEAVLGVSSDHRALKRDACCGYIQADGKRLLTPGCRLFPLSINRGDVCAGCGQSRFVDPAADKLELLNPSLYVFPPQQTVQSSLFSNPKWRKAREQSSRDGDRAPHGCGTVAGLLFSHISLTFASL